MATTISSAFTELKNNLEITGLQKETVSTRQQEVRAAVSNELTVLDTFLTGSYKRSTMIAPLSKSDIDIFVILHSSYYSQDGQVFLLNKLKNVLLKKYTRTPDISRNGQAVTILFNDFIVDVVPAFNRQGGGYIIPNSIEKCWISTDPLIHEEYISQRNLNHNGKLIPLIKMLKSWNRSNGETLINFYIELIAADILNNVTISDYPSGVRYFFDKGRERIKLKAKDPVQYGGQVNGLSSGGVQEAVAKFEMYHSIACNAEAYANSGNIRHAIIEWRKIFGDYFPSYG